MLAHGGRRGLQDDKGQTNNTKPKFNCKISNISFLTQYRFLQHKKETGHRGNNGRPRKL